jgi:hypothetical protein
VRGAPLHSFARKSQRLVDQLGTEVHVVGLNIAQRRRQLLHQARLFGKQQGADCPLKPKAERYRSFTGVEVIDDRGEFGIGPCEGQDFGLIVTEM